MISMLCSVYPLEDGVLSTYSEMTRLAASVATTAGTGSTYAQGRAIRLDMAMTLTVVALLCCCHLSAFPTTGFGVGMNLGGAYCRSFVAAGSRWIHALGHLLDAS